MNYRVELFLIICLTSGTVDLMSKDPPNIHVTKKIALGFTGDVALSTVQSHNRRVICVFNSWAVKPGIHGIFRMKDVNATLCTHLIFELLHVWDENGTLNFVPINIAAILRREEMYTQALSLKKQNSKLKVMLWIEAGNAIWSYKSSRQYSVTNIVQFVKDRALDGVIVDLLSWRSTIWSETDSHRIGRTHLIAALSLELRAQNLELGLTLATDISIVESVYDISALERNVDFFIVIGMAWNGRQVAGHFSPLLPVSGRTVGRALDFILDKISSHKVILGILFSGRSGWLAEAHDSGSGLGAPFVQGGGFRSEFKDNNQVLNYNKICFELRYSRSDWTVYEDTKAKVPFMRDRRQNWVSFEDTKSVAAKVEFGEERGVGGYAALYISDDDFQGHFCGGGITYPLLRTVNYVLSRKANSAITSNPTASESCYLVYYVIVMLLGIIILTLVVLCLVWWKRRGNDNGLSASEIRRFKQGYTHETVEYNLSSEAITLEQLQGEDNVNHNPYDKCLEISHADYEICASEILGSGAYGTVLKGYVQNEVAAVKTVKPLSSKEYVLSLLEEIKLMTYLGRHENIVGLIGAHTALLHRGILYVFVEFCPLGSLEKYLKENRSNFVDLMNNDEFTRDKSPLKEDSEGMSSLTLLIWAHQISNAMQFLASKNVIHGDLATRNVLLRSKHLAKVSDFGLSRKMYEYSNYIKQKQEPLPWRHMSLEALRNMEFSTKSDVWAFGVTVWEIFTLGDIPYPGMSYTFGFVDDLLGGLRMPNPRHATTELYEKTMLQTWDENAKDRPSFEELCTFLCDSVERASFQQEYLIVNDFTS